MVDHKQDLLEAMERILKVGHTRACFRAQEQDEDCECLANAQEIARTAVDSVQVWEALHGNSD